MTTTTVEFGTFAEVFAGNMTTAWLPDGNDLQARANANMGDWFEGRDAPIYRIVETWAIRREHAGFVTFVPFGSREGAERAAARQNEYDEAHA